MPIFEYLCLDCGKTSEILMMAAADDSVCQYCGSRKMQKQLSAHAAYPIQQTLRYPGPKDTSCCGSSPEHAGCAGPGSCCGKHL